MLRPALPQPARSAPLAPAGTLARRAKQRPAQLTGRRRGIAVIAVTFFVLAAYEIDALVTDLAARSPPERSCQLNDRTWLRPYTRSASLAASM